MASLLHALVLYTEGTYLGDAGFSVLARLGGAKVGLERSLTTTLFYLRHPELLQQFLTEWAATQILGAPSPDVERHLHAMHCSRTGRLRNQRTGTEVARGLRLEPTVSAPGFSQRKHNPRRRCFTSAASLETDQDMRMEPEGFPFEEGRDDGQMLDGFSLAEAEKFMQNLPPEFAEVLNAGSAPTRCSTPAWEMPERRGRASSLALSDREDFQAFSGESQLSSFRFDDSVPPPSSDQRAEETRAAGVPRSKVEFFEHQLKILSDLLIDVEQSGRCDGAEDLAVDLDEES
ncbi:conserved hypothetical protein [Neospora caninum Liverpool]|uniref:Uncharacterized protein n=1 Tax=Neospora caninum (strain Liverpool) TaxID=572307 RepID=F0VQM5_NEOCL|nr:conserved hypothetical protein [Neospora caninum Liverpool]CBZ56022.1 conserved hypothetical protein [Neospora caninum Liverpool]CEL70769.1 TPA: hypothetical protein BN1204_064480 [Neospora caninum Liverpool]|eukprot:XP_003886048.1 conserved hypothetical protein [Neospora caninum Liverpool]